MNNSEIIIGFCDNCSLALEGIKSYLETKDFKIYSIDQIKNFEKVKIQILFLDDEYQIKTFRKFKNLNIIFIQLNSDLEHFFSLIDYNLNAILTNSDNLTELEKAIFTVANGNNYYSSSMLKNPIILKRVIDYYRGKQMKSLLKFSKREIEILKNMKKRTSSKQIADKLCISVRTVSKHKENIYRKLGVNNMKTFFEKVNQDRELQHILN